MTEAGEQWIESLQGECSSFDRSEAEFWLRALIYEIRKRMMPEIEQGANPVNALAVAFDNIEQEFFGEEGVESRRELLGNDEEV